MIGAKEKLSCWPKFILGLDKGLDNDLKKELFKCVSHMEGGRWVN